ncbi:MAG TPA: DUF992 domain-containing protein [Stellaceae bacterium]|nr:DUF992 domain-containing protein [Stellaceae bacterium]
MTTIRSLSVALTLLTIGAWAHSEARADDAGGVKAGFLTCNVSSGFGIVFGSSRDVKCDYAAGPDKTEHYTGSISKFGVDIGYLGSAVMVWAVVAPTTSVASGALAGTYAGATGSASVGVGVGANVLVGGSQKQFTLQPVSIEGNTGLNVAGGVAALKLTAVD